MTESDYGRDQRAPSNVGHTPDSFVTAGNGPPPHPGYGYPPPAKRRRTGWIVAGVAALVIVLGAGVAIGVLTRRSSSQPPKPATAPVYSMNAITNACDLVDPAPLRKWSPTPEGSPQHQETRPGVINGAGSLRCQMSYTSGDAVDTAEIVVDVDFTNGDAPPFYDDWKRGDLAKTGAGKASGPIIGIGTQGFWHSETYGDLVTDTQYLLAVLDGNVSVRVRLYVSRGNDVSQVHRAELQSVAEAEVRNTLNGLKQN